MFVEVTTVRPGSKPALIPKQKRGNSNPQYQKQAISKCSLQLGNGMHAFEIWL